MNTCTYKPTREIYSDIYSGFTFEKGENQTLPFSRTHAMQATWSIAHCIVYGYVTHVVQGSMN